MVNNMAARGRMKLKVYLDENGHVSEVFVTPTTKCKDIVLRLQRQIRQSNCCLVEVWQGCERLVPEDEQIQSTLLEWDTDLDDVVFFLRPSEATLPPHIHDSNDIHIFEEELPLPPPPDSNVLAMHNGILELHTPPGLLVGSSGLSLEELQHLAARQQHEIELKEQQLVDKEEQLKVLKQRTRQKIRSSYIDQLESQIQEQDKKMRHLRQIQDEIENYRLSNSALDAELQSMEVHVNSKEQELAMAAAKVEGLTQLLNEQREKWNKGSKQNQKSKEEIELDRLRQELMTRNELNHQQSVQLQAQKQLMAEKHKEMFHLDSQIEQLTEELRRKKSHGNLSLQSPHMTPNGSDSYHDNDNGLWENGESFDWSEFANAEDQYDEQIYSNYNDSDRDISSHTRQSNSRHLETLVEVDETSSTTCSKTSSIGGSSGSQGDPQSPQYGVRSRVSKLASFFEAEVAAQGEPSSKDPDLAAKGAVDRSLNDGHESTTKSIGAEKPRTPQTSVDRDSGFYPRYVASSPLSSPSSLSSLSSLSSTSSANKNTVRHDEFRGYSAESALKVRELKTEGVETFAVPTFQEKPQTLYEAKMFEDTKHIQRDTRKQSQSVSSNQENVSSDSSPFGSVRSSLQQLKTVAMSLNEPGSSATRRNISHNLASSTEEQTLHNDGNHDHHIDEPLQSKRLVNITVKPTGTSFTRKQDEPQGAANPHQGKSPVSMVFTSPTVRDILSEAASEEVMSNHPPSPGSKEKGMGRQSEKNSIRYFDSSDQPVAPVDQKQTDARDGRSENQSSAKPSSQGAISKVKLSLLSTGKRPSPVTREQPELSASTGEEEEESTLRDTYVVPRSPVSISPLVLGSPTRPSPTGPISTSAPRSPVSISPLVLGSPTRPRSPKEPASPTGPTISSSVPRSSAKPISTSAPRSPVSISPLVLHGNPSKSRNPKEPGSHRRPRNPKEPGSPTRPRSPKEPGSHTRPRSPKEPGSPTRPRSPKEPGSHTRPRSPKEPGSHTRPRSHKEPGSPTRPRSPKEPGSPTRPRSPKEPGSHTRPRSHKEPGSPTMPRSPKEPGSHTRARSHKEPGSPTRSRSPKEPGSHTRPRSPKEPGSPTRPRSPKVPGSPTRPISPKEPGSPTRPISPNHEGFESWDEIKPQEGKQRPAKVRPVDSFNAKKAPPPFAPGEAKPNGEKKTPKEVTTGSSNGGYRTEDKSQATATSIDGNRGGSSSSSSWSQQQSHHVTNQKNLSVDKKKSRHVSLDPHAVLLDAAVEGELEQVQSVIRDVDDPSLANGDGITALHNAVCGNHEEVVRFLIEYGCDVNLPDSHGWTPLHCAAANNNLNIVQYLVENGACIFAITGLQRKTPVQCCDKSLAGYAGCAMYLEDIQTNFGMSYGGKVYALYAYSATEDDELSFSCGEELHVLRRGDSTEKEWWWANNCLDQMGYIPRNLFGMSPRVAPEV